MARPPVRTTRRITPLTTPTTIVTTTPAAFIAVAVRAWAMLAMATREAAGATPAPVAPVILVVEYNMAVAAIAVEAAARTVAVVAAVFAVAVAAAVPVVVGEAIIRVVGAAEATHIRAAAAVAAAAITNSSGCD